MSLTVGTRSAPLRQSTVMSYLVCEWQAGRVVAGEPRGWVGTAAWLGSIEHKCIELLHRPDPPSPSHLVDHAAELVLGEESTPLLIGQLEEIADGLPVVEEHVQNYLDLGWWEFHDRGLLGVEIPFRVKVGRWWVRGTIDLVHEPEPGFLRLVDLKTGIPSTTHSRGLNIQLPLYSTGLRDGEIYIARREEWVRLDRAPDVAVLFESRRLERYKRNGRRGDVTWKAGDLKGSPAAQVPITNRDLDRVAGIVDEAGARLNHLYTRGPLRMQLLRSGFAYGACHHCGFRRQCGVDLPGHFETERDLIAACERTWSPPRGEA